MLGADPRLTSLRDSISGLVLHGSAGVKYHVGPCIGEGSQGWVFKANWDEPGGLVVIVKVLRPDAINGESLERFQREAEVLRMLSQQARPNPHIVRFFDNAVVQVRNPFGGEPFSLPFTVLEYVNGPTLEATLRATAGRGMAVERVRRLTRQVVLALEAVHAQKIVHRDLKPSNIMLAQDGGSEVAKVTDFGLVKLVDVSMQRTAQLAGASIGYAPPEQYEPGNRRVRATTDVFSLSAILYEMLTGKPAFPYGERENPLIAIARIVHGERPNFLSARDSMSSELGAADHAVQGLDVELRRGLASAPEARHETVTALWNAIDPHLRSAMERHVIKSASPASPFEATEGTGTPSHAVAVAARAGARGSQVPASAYGRPNSSGRIRTSTEVAANPTAWTWHVPTRPIQLGTVRAAAFSPNGEVAIASGPGGLARWERGAWIAIAAPPSVSPAAIRGISWTLANDALAYGDRGLAFRLAPNGAYETWKIPDRDFMIFGAFPNDAASMTLIGERVTRQTISRELRGNTVGVVAHGTRDVITMLVEVHHTTRLRDAARLTNGTILACGDHGMIARVEGGNVVSCASVCSAPLHAIAAMPDGGAVTVGAGGHALYLPPRGDAQIEEVDTTRDLVSLAIGEDGAPWAGTTQTRILRRSGSRWIRMNGDIGIFSSVVALWSGARVVRAVCDDGAVIEGQLMGAS